MNRPTLFNQPYSYRPHNQLSRRWRRAIGGLVLALAWVNLATAACADEGTGGSAVIRPLEYQRISVGQLSLELPVDWQWAQGDSRSKFDRIRAGSRAGDAVYVSELPMPPQAGFDAEAVRVGVSALLAGELDRLRGRPRQGYASDAKFKETYATTVTVAPTPIRKHLAEGFRCTYDIRLKGYEQRGHMAVFKLGTNWVIVRCITISSAGSLAFDHVMETLEFKP